MDTQRHTKREKHSEAQRDKDREREGQFIYINWSEYVRLARAGLVDIFVIGVRARVPDPAEVWRGCGVLIENRTDCGAQSEVDAGDDASTDRSPAFSAVVQGTGSAACLVLVSKLLHGNGLAQRLQLRRRVRVVKAVALEEDCVGDVVPVHVCEELGHKVLPGRSQNGRRRTTAAPPCSRATPASREHTT